MILSVEDFSPEELLAGGLLGGGGSSGLALAVARAVVGVVEAFALEVHGGRVQHPLDGHARVGVDAQRIVAEGLLHLERRAVRASVLVDRHRQPIIGASID